jgi:DNA-binding IclR family transcriptional regulator
MAASTDASFDDPPRASRVQSVDRAVRLLRAVAAATGAESSVTALAETCGLNRATAWRILMTLERAGMVSGNRETGQYAIGLGLVELARGAGADALAQSAHAMLEKLSLQTGETAAFAVTRIGALVYVDEVHPKAVVAAGWRGRAVPLHATSTGKVLLAFSPPEDVDRMLGPTLQRWTDTTVTDRGALMAELAEARQKGYAVCRGEFEESAYGVSAPVLDTAHRPIAVVSVWGPGDRVTEDRFDTLGALVRDAARTLTPG